MGGVVAAISAVSSAVSASGIGSLLSGLSAIASVAGAFKSTPTPPAPVVQPITMPTAPSLGTNQGQTTAAAQAATLTPDQQQSMNNIQTQQAQLQRSALAVNTTNTTFAGNLTTSPTIQQATLLGQ